MFLLFPQQSALGVSCGDHVCNRPPAGSENCSTCPVDCGCTGGTVCSAGVCIAPSPTPITPPPTIPPTSGPSPTPGGGGGTTTTTNATPEPSYPPSLTISHQPNAFTNTKSLFFAGIAKVEKGEISSVSYSITNGAQWITAQSTHGVFNQSSEGFSFTTPSLADGQHSIRIRAQSTRGFTTETSTAITIVSTPPTVQLFTFSPNPTKNTQPQITGTATTKYGTIARVQISLDNGTTWLAAPTAGRFTFTPQPLEDDNYTVLARAYDNAGNVGISQPQTLIVDTIPPIVGGSLFLLGPQVLTPDREGITTLAAQVPATIVVSMKGGIINAKIVTDQTSVRLVKQQGSNLWNGNLSFHTSGVKKLSVVATDGAGNTTTRPYGAVLVEPLGLVQDSKTQKPLAHAVLSLFYFDYVSNQWTLWDGTSYGQQNPQTTTSTGLYSFMVPPGKYYLRAAANGFYTAESAIITNTVTTTLGAPIKLTPQPGLFFSLPFFGDIAISLPTPPKSFVLEEPTEKVMQQNDLIGKKAPQIALPLENASVKTLDALGSKKIILSFLTPWSSLSLQQAPILSQLSRSLPQNTSLAVILLQETPSAAQTFAKRGQYLFPLVGDTTGISGMTYGVTTVPYTVFIDSKGIVNSITTSVVSQKEIEDIVNNMQ